MRLAKSSAIRTAGLVLSGILLVAGSALGVYFACSKLWPEHKTPIATVADDVITPKSPDIYPLSAKVTFANDVRFALASSGDGWASATGSQGMLKYKQSSTNAGVSMGIMTNNPVQKTDERQTAWFQNNTAYSLAQSFSTDKTASEVSRGSVMVPTASGAKLELATVVEKYNDKDGEYRATFVFRQSGAKLLIFMYTAKATSSYTETADKMIAGLTIEGEVTYVSAQQ